MSRKETPVLLAVLATCAGCTLWEEREPEAEKAVQVQMEVKAALLEAEQVAAAPIRVEYEPGLVRLSGFVGSEEERARAAETARAAAPDLRIVNDLQVWRPGE